MNRAINSAYNTGKFYLCLSDNCFIKNKNAKYTNGFSEENTFIFNGSTITTTFIGVHVQLNFISCQLISKSIWLDCSFCVKLISF